MVRLCLKPVSTLITPSVESTYLIKMDVCLSECCHINGPNEISLSGLHIELDILRVVEKRGIRYGFRAIFVRCVVEVVTDKTGHLGVIPIGDGDHNFGIVLSFVW